MIFAIVLATTPLETVQRVQAHLLIHDTAAACEEAKRGVSQYPESRPLFEAWLQALAKRGEFAAAWNQYAARYPDAYERRELLECLAWGVIEEGARSAAPMIRVFALLGAFYAQDAKGVKLLHAGLKDSNAFVRGAAVKLAMRLHDLELQDEIVRLFQSERNWQVRLAAIQALGAMKIASSRSDLVALIGSPQAQAEEKVAAIAALVELLDTAERREIELLARSDRAGLRLLACEVMEHFGLSHRDLLDQLTKDTRAEVRAAAWHALGALRQDVKSSLDADPTVALTAAWSLTLSNPTAGQEALAPWLTHESAEVRRLAAAALVATGQYGLPLALKTFSTTSDPYVRLNLALGFLGQRVLLDKACSCLAEGLFQQKERWMWEETGKFEALAPSTVKHDEAIPNYPEAVNQMARLEILNKLALLKYPETGELLRRYLKEKRFEVSGMAALLLLTEGDESAIDAVQELLKDPDSKVRTQAAFILSLWGQGDEAIAELQGSYKDADRELKEKILEGLGRAGSASSIPFLVERLQEPSPMLRLIAAAALLETLYH